MEQQDRIVAKAHELFMRYGIRSISMDEIANNLGISKKTIYQFFTDKDSLVSSVVDIEIRNNEQKCAYYSELAENPVHEICLAMDMVEDMLKIMNPALIFDMQKYHPSAYRKFEVHINSFLYEIVKGNLEQGMAQGLYRAEINVEIVTRFRLSSIFMVFNPELFPLGKNDLGTVIRSVTELFLYGVCTHKGQELIYKYNQERLNQSKP